MGGFMIIRPVVAKGEDKRIYAEISLSQEEIRLLRVFLECTHDTFKANREIILVRALISGLLNL
jgi:hypothetical protein